MGFDLWFPERYINKENKNKVLGNAMIVEALSENSNKKRHKHLKGFETLGLVVSEPKTGREGLRVPRHHGKDPRLDSASDS